MLTESSIQRIINSGGSIIINSTAATESVLIRYANALHDVATLTVRNSQNLTESTMCRIAAAKPGQVVFDFSTI